MCTYKEFYAEDVEKIHFDSVEESYANWCVWQVDMDQCTKTKSELLDALNELIKERDSNESD